MEKELDDATALEALGYTSIETPGGGTVTTENSQVGLPEEQKATKPEETIKVDEPTDETIKVEKPTEKVSSTQNPDGSLTEAETQRRTWQSEAAKAKAESDMLKASLHQMQEVNKQLINVVQPFTQKYQKPVEEEKEPEVDYVVDGYFDPQKHADYMKRYNSWLTKTISKNVSDNVTQSFSKKQQEDQTRAQLEELVKEFPEYRNPLTGEVDIDRVKGDLTVYTGGKSIVDLMREAKGTKKPFVDTSLEVIRKNAERPPSVVGSPQSQAEKKTVPKEMMNLIDTFGGLDIPEGFDGLK